MEDFEFWVKLLFLKEAPEKTDTGKETGELKGENLTKLEQFIKKI